MHRWERFRASLFMDGRAGQAFLEKSAYYWFRVDFSCWLHTGPQLKLWSDGWARMDSVRVCARAAGEEVGGLLHSMVESNMM